MSLVAALGEAAIIDYRAAYAALRRGDEGVEHEPMADTECGDVRDFWHLCDARIAGPAENRRVIRVDRVDRAGEADPVERDDQPSSDRRLLGGADDRDRFRPKQRVEPHPRPPFGAPVERQSRTGRQTFSRGNAGRNNAAAMIGCAKRKCGRPTAPAIRWRSS